MKKGRQTYTFSNDSNNKFREEERIKLVEALRASGVSEELIQKALEKLEENKDK